MNSSNKSIFKISSDKFPEKFISSELERLFLGGTNLVNAYSTDRLKFGLMYNNSSKKYRQYLSENRGISKLWSLSNAAGGMALFFDGAGY